jgi:hypothetical protein
MRGAVVNNHCLSLWHFSVQTSQSPDVAERRKAEVLVSLEDKTILKGNQLRERKEGAISRRQTKAATSHFNGEGASKEVISLFSTNERVDNELTRVNLIWEIVFIVLKYKLMTAFSLYSNTLLYRECFITMISRCNFVLRSSIITFMNVDFITRKTRHNRRKLDDREITLRFRYENLTFRSVRVLACLLNNNAFPKRFIQNASRSNYTGCFNIEIYRVFHRVTCRYQTRVVLVNLHSQIISFRDTVISLS